MFLPALIIDHKIWALAARYVREGRFLDLKNDITFKAFFGGKSPESAYCRCHMLSAVLGRKVTSAQVINPQLISRLFGKKVPVLDLHCILEDMTEIDVEIQGNYYPNEFINRTVYYAARLFTDNLDRGRGYSALNCACQITFMNFIINKDEHLHHLYRFQDERDNTVLTDRLQIHLIELPKLKKIAEEPLEKLSDLEFWSMIIFAGDNPNVRQWLAQFPEYREELKMASTLMQKLSSLRRRWAFMLATDRWTLDWTSRWYSGIDEAREEGARSKARETARNFLLLGIPPEQVAKGTGLDISDVQQIASELKQ